MFLFITVLNQLNAQSLQSLVNQGYAKAYNMDLESAERIYNRIINLYPEDPHGYYLIAQMYYWTYMGSKDKGEYQIFTKFAELAQEKIDKILTEDDNNVKILYLAGNLALFTAIANAVNESSVDAFWSSKSAVNYFEKAILLNPRFFDAYLGLGLFDYAISFVPEFLKWAVNLTGLTSDKERGLRYIKTAFNKGTFETTEAAFYLSKIYTDYLADYDSAYFYIQSIINKYPKNTLFHYQYAVSLIKGKELNKAIKPLNTVIRLNNKRFPNLTALAHYRKGEVYFKKNQFKSAIKEYETFLDLYKDLDFTGIAAYNIAISNKMLSNDEEYKKYMGLASDGNPDLYEDAYAMTKSEYFLKNDIDEIDLKLVRMKNLIEYGKNKSAYDTLKVILPLIENNDQKVLALSYLSESAFNLKKYAESVQAAENILSVKPKIEKWTIPFSYFIQAKANWKVGARSQAKDFLLKAESENKFEFQDSIQALIENLKRKLKRF
jgi:tetratricopeptide (TPR) repeat protein